MKKYKVEKVEQIVVDKITCNYCGEVCNTGFDEPVISSDVKDFISGGYCSEYLGDGTRYYFDICEKCLVEEIFPKFKIAVVKDDGDDYMQIINEIKNLK
jgi:hypothetical protein